jgi:hypothetical protein
MISNARTLVLAQAVLSLIGPNRCTVIQDPGGTVKDTAAIETLTAEVAAAEAHGLDADQRPMLRLFAAQAYTHGAYAGIVTALQARAQALNP